MREQRGWPDRRVRTRRGRFWLPLAVLLTFIGAFGGLTAAPERAYACSCAFDRDGQIEFADVIFAGTVTERRESLPNRIGAGSSFALNDYVFEVDQAWKGNVYETMTVATGTASESCGADFREGNRYIVLAKQDGTRLTTSLCSGNALYIDGTRPEILAQLGEPAEPSPGSSPGAWIRSYLWAIIPGALAIVFGIAWLAVRRRRARRRF